MKTSKQKLCIRMKPVKKLTLEQSALAAAQENEDWSDFDLTCSDGLEDLD